MINSYFAGRASNGFHFELNASRQQPGGALVSLELRQGDASALYVARHPRRVTRRRISADFGELGRVSLRLDAGRYHRFGSRCKPVGVHFGRFEGAIRFKGESDYTRVKELRPTGYIASTSVSSSRHCQGHGHWQRADSFKQSAVVSSCGGEAGAGLFAAEEEPGSETEWLAGKTERSRDLLVFRSVALTGAARNLEVSRDLRSATLRPPEPFLGRGSVKRRELTGRIRVLMPGAGLVQLTPGPAEITRFDDFTPPRCFPLLGLVRAGSSAAQDMARVLGR